MIHHPFFHLHFRIMKALCRHLKPRRCGYPHSTPDLKETGLFLLPMAEALF